MLESEDPALALGARINEIARLLRAPSAGFNGIGCTADLDCDGSLTVSDQHAFGNAFDAMDPVADRDGDGSFTFFVDQEFGSTLDLGCP